MLGEYAEKLPDPVRSAARQAADLRRPAAGQAS